MAVLFLLSFTTEGLRKILWKNLAALYNHINICFCLETLQPFELPLKTPWTQWISWQKEANYYGHLKWITKVLLATLTQFQTVYKVECFRLLKFLQWDFPEILVLI